MTQKGEKKKVSINPVPKDTKDATSLLLKLTPQLIKSDVDLDSQANARELALPGKSSGTDSIGSEGTLDDIPDWYEKLSDDHVNAFKEVFDLLDSGKTGALDPGSLFKGLKRVDSDITQEEVNEVLKNLDKDGNGEIDCDEFLYYISGLGQADEGDEDDVHVRKRRDAFTKRQCLYYSAITEFTINRIMDFIDRAQSVREYKPHVLSHYTAGERLLGLTDRQLALKMKDMRKSLKKYKDSPYAKPLNLVVSAGPRKTVKKAIRPTSVPMPSLSPAPASPPMIPDVMESPAPKSGLWSAVYKSAKTFITEKDVKKDMFDFSDVVRMLLEKNKVMAKLPGAHKIVELQTKLAEGMVSTAQADQQEQGGAVSFRHPFGVIMSAGPSPATKRKIRRMSAGWTIPHFDRNKVALPILKIKYKLHKPTIEDLPNIREKVAQAICNYYKEMRQELVRNSEEHWDKMYLNKIRSQKLLENFRIVYRAYSPHKEEEAFVVCPWVPGLFRAVRHVHRELYVIPPTHDHHLLNIGGFRPRPDIGRLNIPSFKPRSPRPEMGQTSRSDIGV